MLCMRTHTHTHSLHPPMHTKRDARYTRWKEAVKRSMHWQQTSAQRTSNKSKKSKYSTLSLPLIITCTYSLQDEPISHTHTCTHARTHTRTHTCTHTHTHMRTHARTHTHSRTHTHAHTHTRTHTTHHSHSGLHPGLCDRGGGELLSGCTSLC